MEHTSAEFWAKEATAIVSDYFKFVSIAHLGDLKKPKKTQHEIYEDLQKSQSEVIIDMVRHAKRRKKNRCLVKKGGHFEYVNVQDIAFVESEDSLTFLFTFDERRYVYPKSVEQLYEEFDKDYFSQASKTFSIRK